MFAAIATIRFQNFIIPNGNLFQLQNSSPPASSLTLLISDVVSVNLPLYSALHIRRITQPLPFYSWVIYLT